MEDIDRLVKTIVGLEPKNGRMAPQNAFKNFEELETSYQESLKLSEHTKLDLGKWLRSFHGELRPLVPGELAIVLADTGVGKTAALQNIAMAAAPLSTLLFELELPEELMFERFITIQEKRSGSDVEEAYRRGNGYKPTQKLRHIHVCSYAGISVSDIQELIEGSEEKTGHRPALVIIDYLGLIRGKGSSRYEKISDIAEELKIVAKSTKTIIITGCQIHRKSEDKAGEIFLHDAKDSGAIENSCGVLLGLWREGERGEIMNVKIVKNTKGKSGFIIKAQFRGQTLTIHE